MSPSRATLGRTLLVAAYAVLVVLRAPRLVYRPRLWAEDATLWLAAAESKPWWEALLSSYGGYVSITANLAGVLAAHLVPLEEAPFVNVALSFAIQLLPALAVVAAGPLALRPTPWTAAALAVLLLAVPGQETWLNTANATILLALATGLVLASPAAGAAWLKRITVLLAGLTGPVSVFLLPLYAVRALHERDRERVVQTAILGAGACVQLAAFLLRPAGRALSADVAVLVAAMFVKVVVMPFAGVGAAETLGAMLREPLLAGAPLLASAMALVLVALAALVWTSGVAEARWTLAAAVVILVLSSSAAHSARIDMVSGIHSSRYFYAPNALVGIALLAALTPGSRLKGPSRLVAGGLLALSLAHGLHEFLRPAPWFFDGPDWRTEVERWRQDPAYTLSVWPPPLRAAIPRTVGPSPFMLRDVRPPAAPATGGTHVLLVGSGLHDLAAVRFGGVPSPEFHGFADGAAVAAVPPGTPERGEVVIANRQGDTSRHAFAYAAASETLVASPVVLTAAGRTVLTWSVVGARAASLSGVGEVPAGGHTTVNVARTTRFELFVPGPEAPRSVTVTVLNQSRGDLDPPRPASLARPGVGSVELTWPAVARATGYDVRLFGASDGRSIVTQAVPARTDPVATELRLPPGAYVAAVRACSSAASDAACGPFATLAFEQASPGPLDPPRLAQPSQGTILLGPTHLVAWTAPPAEDTDTAYEIAVDEMSTGRRETVGVVAGAVRSPVTFRRSGVYALRVRGCGMECGAYSSPVHVLVRVRR